jgi:hypothetical protein
MTRIAAGVLSILLATQLPAASRTTVQQLAKMLVTAQPSSHGDDNTANGIAGVELTERLTEATLSGLSLGQGERTRFALRILADESAFLEPPAAELPAGGPPAAAEQKAILARAVAYALSYIHNLPNFICTQTVRRLDNDPSRQIASVVGLMSHADTAAWRMQARADVARRLSERDTAVSELTFNNGAESHQHVRTSASSSPQTMQGLATSSPGTMQGLATSGEFGGVIKSVFSEDSDANAEWSHWESVDGKRVAVFQYSVDLAHSNFFVYWCCGEQGETLQKKVAYRGTAFIEPASGALFRISWQAVDIPATFPMRSSGTVIEYRAVNIGGSFSHGGGAWQYVLNPSWLCPLRSVTVSDSVNMFRAQATDAYVHSLNQMEFTGYHKFESESRLVAEEPKQ